MSRESFSIMGKIVTGIATDKDRQRLAHITQDKANSLKPQQRLNLFARKRRAALKRSEG